MRTRSCAARTAVSDTASIPTGISACRTAPPTPPPGSVPPTAAAARGAVCGAEVTVATPGSDGAGGYTASVMVTASNLGNATIPAPWTLAIANPAYTGVSQARRSLAPGVADTLVGRG